MAADLHIHTTISDGSDTPEQVVNRALELGLQYIAITDHDIVDGVNLARIEARGKGIEVLAGVEISCFYGENEIHVLGYFKQPNHPELLAVLDEMRDYRLIRAQKIIDKLSGLGLNIKWERVQELAGEGSLGRPHIADALVEKGFIPNRETAFKKYIGRGCSAYVPRKKISPVDAIKLISRAGGVPVLAHPGTGECGYILPELIEHGLKGLEVWHPHHSPIQRQYYLKQCQEKGLIPTGGSDYHGAKHHSCNCLGSVTAPMESVRRIKELLK
ncbi:PHP domain-containing protein [Desulfofalx alkaliphila]|uniref:PHP domain-containing protein n=1 Tax=Desulfofalx alkaliphila TaxID=105483 RepID=UPI0004E223D8|nr:PHP domain-containing protein [Desulfofalx alkaliphila]